MSTSNLAPDVGLIKLAISCKCPKCHKGDLFKSGFNLNDNCPECGLNIADNDVGDGPAVFLIFILGFLLVPAALLVEKLLTPPLWAHAILWTIVALGFTLLSLKPLKAYIIALQFKHRPGDWS